ncbi:hypothetical protein MSAN_00925200 [Mycena sanguinolenta]|uniref:Uncharacterized protein n=1 Tax=Mycena sanguinolenta TaxID=230812 RepID=A0A8H7DC49_9AGAR|nr:hypothetical protein MSAN_00925200 [Mycena sanguinolenta]
MEAFSSRAAFKSTPSSCTSLKAKAKKKGKARLGRRERARRVREADLDRQVEEYMRTEYRPEHGSPDVERASIRSFLENLKWEPVPARGDQKTEEDIIAEYEKRMFK